MAITKNVSKLKGKTSNETAQAQLDAIDHKSTDVVTNTDWNTLVEAVEELQSESRAAIKSIVFNGSQPITPDGDGKASITYNQNVTYLARLTIDNYEKLQRGLNIKNGTKYPVRMYFKGYRIEGAEVDDFGNKGTLTISKSVDGTNYTDVASLSIDPIMYSEGDRWTLTVNFDEYISNTNKNYFRLSVSVPYHNVESDQDDVTTSVQRTIIINSLDFTVTNARAFQTPIVVYDKIGHDDTTKRTTFPLSYKYSGSVDKTLHIRVTGHLGSTQMDYVLGSSQQISDPKDFAIPDSSTTDLLHHGVHTVIAWMTCDDGTESGVTLFSNFEVSQFMVINTDTLLTTEDERNTSFLMIQNLLNSAENFVRTTLCQYAVFRPLIRSNQMVSSDVKTAITFMLTNNSSDPLNDVNLKKYYTQDFNVDSQDLRDLDVTVEIEHSGAGDPPTQYSTFFRAFLVDDDGDKVNCLNAPPTITTHSNGTVTFTENTYGDYQVNIDNSRAFTPTSGATFILNPKVRDNSETNFRSIINSATGEIIPSTWTGFNGISDGWVQGDTQRVLRILAGQKINFKFNPFSQFLSNSNSAMTIEFDYKVSGITDPETAPLIQCKEPYGDREIGFEFQALYGWMETISANTKIQQDWLWQEDERVHIAINIHNKVPTRDQYTEAYDDNYDISGTIALVRIFINGVICREFKFNPSNNKEFCDSTMSNGGITLGSQYADLDIYSIRCYQEKELSSKAVMNDYLTTLASADEKERLRSENDILNDQTDLIDVEKLKTKGKSILIWHGDEPYQYKSANQVGYWEIYQYLSTGALDQDHSGTIGKLAYEKYIAESKANGSSDVECLVATRQGSTAKTYYYSNLQTKIKDIGYKVTITLDQLHSSIKYEDTGDVDEKTGFPIIKLTGGNIDGKYTLVEGAVGPTGKIKVKDGWWGFDGLYRGLGYQVTAGVPLGQKMVNKINYASCMQSHLIGGVASYNDLHTALVGKNTLQKRYDELHVADGTKARVCKINNPFFFFVQPDGAASPSFRGPCTFGPGKMDDVTWGFNKKEDTGFAFLEGAENNHLLADMRVPWDDTHVFPIYESELSEGVTTYEVVGFAYPYNDGEFTGIDMDKAVLDSTYYLGNTQVTKKDTYDTVYKDMKATVMQRIKDTWNFLYWHNPRIKPYTGGDGSLESFKEDNQVDDTYAYWMTSGTYKYHLYRKGQKVTLIDGNFNKATIWEPAGYWNESSRTYEARNLSTDPICQSAYTNSPNKERFDALNKEFISALVEHARNNISNYFNMSSVQFHYCYVNYFLAGSDNCSKNTYYMLDPKTERFELHQDDVDTIFATDNSGLQTKPYYLARWLPYSFLGLDKNGKAIYDNNKLYEGEGNSLFNLTELLYEKADQYVEGKTSLQEMMYSILTKMCNLVSTTDDLPGLTATQKTTPWGFLNKYFFSVQRYFPMVAYNEAARIRYEYPASFGYTSIGRNVPPITQSLGNQLQAEMQYMKRRLVMIATYAAWGDFEYATPGNLGINDAVGALSLQAVKNPNNTTAEYKFKITPHQFIYPTGANGGNTVDRHILVAPGQTYELNLGTVDGDTLALLYAAHYYRSFGNLGNISTSKVALTIRGKRLVELKANPTVLYQDTDAGSPTYGQMVPTFRPNGVKLEDAGRIIKFSLNGCTQVGGDLDLGSLAACTEVDIRNTKFTSIVVPKTHTLTKIHLNHNLEKIALDNVPNLDEISVQGTTRVRTLECKSSSQKAYNYIIDLAGELIKLPDI